MYLLTKELYFPPPTDAGKTGLVAIGGDLSIERVLLAYQMGIFPWYDADEPILWWSPEKRMVVFPHDFKPSKSMRNIINRRIFTVTFNQHFRAVIENCRCIQRKDQDGTWLSEEMVETYCRLHTMGKAKSVEVWKDGELVGGLYGVDMNRVFCGESMFSKVSNASKVAFVALVDSLRENNYKLLDCQLHNDHLESLGAVEIPREEYLEILKAK